MLHGQYVEIKKHGQKCYIHQILCIMFTIVLQISSHISTGKNQNKREDVPDQHGMQPMLGWTLGPIGLMTVFWNGESNYGEFGDIHCFIIMFLWIKLANLRYPLLYQCSCESNWRIWDIHCFINVPVNFHGEFEISALIFAGKNPWSWSFGFSSCRFFQPKQPPETAVDGRPNEQVKGVHPSLSAGLLWKWAQKRVYPKYGYLWHERK